MVLKVVAKLRKIKSKKVDLHTNQHPDAEVFYLHINLLDHQADLQVEVLERRHVKSESIPFNNG